MIHARRSQGAVDLFMLLLLAIVIVALVFIGLMVDTGQMANNSDGTPLPPRMGAAILAPPPLTEAELSEAQQKLLADLRAKVEATQRDLAIQLEHAKRRETEASLAYNEYQRRLAAMDATVDDEEDSADERVAPTPR